MATFRKCEFIETDYLICRSRANNGFPYCTKHKPFIGYNHFIRDSSIGRLVYPKHKFILNNIVEKKVIGKISQKTGKLVKLTEKDIEICKNEGYPV